VSADYYIYEHWRPDKNVCFYVGMGKGRRARVMYKRSDHHSNIQAKLKRNGQSVEVRLIATGLSREEAVTREIERISYWRALKVNLVNLTAGGDGSLNPSDTTRELMRQRKLGKILTEEHKDKIAKSTRAALSSPEVRAKISAGLKIAVQRPDVRAKLLLASRSQVRTPEHNAKIAASHKGKKLSPEHAEKARMASVGRKQRPEEIERRRLANTGKKRSPEFCELMRKLARERADKKKLMSLSVDKQGMN
jgi:predicted GIY-YIG superfamily endonuclease